MLKREARILGLGASIGKSRRVIVVGVIFRGNLWLDGMITCSLEPDGRDNTLGVSRTAMKSKQYSQLHAVVLSKELNALGAEIDVAELGRRLRLPVIALVKKRQLGKMKIDKSVKASKYRIVMRTRAVAVLAYGIDLEGVEDLFAVACARDSPIPEAARVADLIAEQVTLKWNSLRLA